MRCNTNNFILIYLNPDLIRSTLEFDLELNIDNRRVLLVYFQALAVNSMTTQSVHMKDLGDTIHRYPVRIETRSTAFCLQRYLALRNFHKTYKLLLRKYVNEALNALYPGALLYTLI